MPNAVVADSSPVIALVNIGESELLFDMFGGVYIPPEVVAELRLPTRSAAVLEWIAAPPSWLHIQAPSQVTPIPNLHSGETAAIALAQELQPALLLIDDDAGRRAAVDRGLAIAGTVGFLLTAAEREHVDLRDAFDRLKRTDFWFSHRKLDRICDEFGERQRKRREDRGRSR
jgi:predicted nucleic acid-binding protein